MTHGVKASTLDKSFLTFYASKDCCSTVNFINKVECPAQGQSRRLFSIQISKDRTGEVQKPVTESISIIMVDRTIRPVYPDWVKVVMQPELENTGPMKYDGTMFIKWLLPGQEIKTVSGNRIYTYLVNNNILSTCINLRDLEEIQKKGTTFFQNNFDGKAVFAWKSVSRFRNNHISVPYLCRRGRKLVLDWRWLGRNWGIDSPALRFTN